MSSQKCGASKNAKVLVSRHLNIGLMEVKGKRRKGWSKKRASLVTLDMRKAGKENELRCRVLK